MDTSKREGEKSQDEKISEVEKNLSVAINETTNIEAHSLVGIDFHQNLEMENWLRLLIETQMNGSHHCEFKKKSGPMSNSSTGNRRVNTKLITKE
ncbi:hypothetical protein JTB14_024906 [Gonioctena quinquepunctata]|nr:hypothetical protein JTB14_024906 [Gonioctena quinquepunctata]